MTAKIPPFPLSAAISQASPRRWFWWVRPACASQGAAMSWGVAFTVFEECMASVAVAPRAGRGGRSQRGGSGRGERGGGYCNGTMSGNRTGDQRQPRSDLQGVGPRASLLVEWLCGGAYSGASSGEDQRHLVRRGRRGHRVIPTTAQARLRTRLPCAAATPSRCAAAR